MKTLSAKKIFSAATEECTIRGVHSTLGEDQQRKGETPVVFIKEEVETSSDSLAGSQTCSSNLPFCEVCRVNFKSIDEAKDHMEEHIFYPQDTIDSSHPASTSCLLESYFAPNDAIQEDTLVPRQEEHGSEQFGKPLPHTSVLQTQSIQFSNFNPYMCGYCGKSYSTSNFLEIHLKYHNKEKLQAFLESEKTSMDSTSPESHHFKSHPLKKPHSYKEYKKSTTQSHILKKLLRIRTADKPYEYRLCSTGVIKSYHLQAHLRTHNEERPFQCECCGKTFTHSSTLRNHQRLHSGERPFVCEECGKTFTRSGCLKVHSKIHSGQRPYKCKECGKAFTRSSTLRDHFKIHTGEKPHKCKVCGKTFIKPYNLKLHLRNHTGETPYECNVCGRAFTKRDCLVTHLKRKDHMNV